MAGIKRCCCTLKSKRLYGNVTFGLFVVVILVSLNDAIDILSNPIIQPDESEIQIGPEYDLEEALSGFAQNPPSNLELDDPEQTISGGPETYEEAVSLLELESSPHIGQAAGLSLNPEGNLVIFHRSGRVWDQYSFDEKNRLNYSLGMIPNATIVVLDSETGNLIGEHGKNMFYMPHGLTIDIEGNHWITDVGSHQVHKLDKNFQKVLTLGQKLVPGSDDAHFCKPTDVAVTSTGEFFVADGYCNSRIMKFDKEGKLITKFGKPNTSKPPGVGEFFVPHSLALIEDLNLLCVADRENERIQCFSAGLDGSMRNPLHRRAYIPTGKFFTKAEGIGRIFAIREKDHYLIGVTDRDGNDQLEPQLFIMDMNTGIANTFAKGLKNAHAIAIGDKGDIYVSQISPNQIVKFNIPTKTEF